MNYACQQLDSNAIYRLLTALVTPRPIAWISTRGPDGAANLAPYSFFTVASLSPPVLLVSQVNPRHGGDKDTLRNLAANGECVVNIVSHELAAAMNASCAPLPYGDSEFAAAGLAPCASQWVAAPGVALARARIECRLRDIQRIGDGPMGGSLMLLDVLGISVDDALLQDGAVDAALLDAIGKLGGDGYSTTRERFEQQRPA
ncbi:flavin reductase family protein [Vogesella sp. LIG4]|uniref:flavin reductase family protein n=1 Tax=Vogesella sp. LIG4 TaxID=1192162 RepID=UPI00081FC86F|nr:flavin reductase family protein [Vogesella sp. LIG4]SCK13775.1 NADH-FMN oxidoreductase RutF, flavin reductase (DIM6/NTAB) family [Vogesella sp. LIG4]